MTKRESTSIRIDSDIKAALDMVAAERQLITGKNVSINDAIWYLLEIGAKHITERVIELTKDDRSTHSGGKD